MKPLMYLLTMLSTIASYSTAQNAEFIPLGDLPGGSNYSSASAVTADGSSVVGVSSSSQSFWGEAVLWDRNGIRPLGFIQDQSNASAISPSGDWISGGTNTSAGWQAFAWSESTGMFGIGDLPGGEFLSEARGVSNGGTVIVGNSSSGAAGPGLREAFRWTPDGGMVGLGFLGGQDHRKRSGANAVSADGSVIVGYTSTDNDNLSLAFRWTESTGMVLLTDLPGGRDSTGVSDVSSDGGWLVGGAGSENYDGTFRSEAVLWHPDGTAEGLGILDRGMDIAGRSGAYSVSDDGRIVTGNSFSFEFGEELFFWTRENGMRPLEEYLLIDHSIDVDAMGWNLTYAIISGDGRTLVGTGTSLDGGFHSEGWMVRLPIPAPTTLAPLAAMGLLGMRRRR